MDIEADLALVRVRLLNDEARQYLTDGLMVLSRGLLALSEEDQAEILDRVRNFEEFAPESDPYSVRDFGAFGYAGHTVIWKIDCHDRDEFSGSLDPADPRVTKRVLTIMLAGEY